MAEWVGVKEKGGKRGIGAGHMGAPRISKKSLVHSKLLAALLCIGLILALAYFAFPLLPAPSPNPDSQAIEIFISPQVIFEGSLVQARAFSSCGNFSLFLDEEELASGENRIEVSFLARTGEHLLYAKSASCYAKKAFTVQARECAEGENRTCAFGQCKGVQFCINGKFSECYPEKKVCVPGERRGCSLNSCQFGYMVCDPCGTGFGPCKAYPEEAIAGSLVCPG